MGLRLFWAKRSKIFGRSFDCTQTYGFRTIAHLLPMFLQMLKDEFPDVRLHIISKLELVNNGMSSYSLQVGYLLTTPSNWHRTPLTISPSRNSAIGRGQTMASSPGHYRIHPTPRKPAWGSIFRRKTKYLVHELARRHSFFNKRSRDPKSKEADRGLWR